eukprot:4058745-Prymnesium_polylepis.2
MAIDATIACEQPARLNLYGPDTTLTMCCALARRAFQPGHRPSKFPQKEQPDMSDFERRQPRASCDARCQQAAAATSEAERAWTDGPQ